MDVLTLHLLHRVGPTTVKLQVVHPPAGKGLGINLDFVQCGPGVAHTCVFAHVSINAQLQSTVMDVARQFCNAPWEPGGKMDASFKETNLNVSRISSSDSWKLDTEGRGPTWRVQAAVVLLRLSAWTSSSRQ